MVSGLAVLQLCNFVFNLPKASVLSRDGLPRLRALLPVVILFFCIPGGLYQRRIRGTCFLRYLYG